MMSSCLSAKEVRKFNFNVRARSKSLRELNVKELIHLYVVLHCMTSECGSFLVSVHDMNKLIIPNLDASEDIVHELIAQQILNPYLEKNNLLRSDGYIVYDIAEIQTVPNIVEFQSAIKRGVEQPVTYLAETIYDYLSHVSLSLQDKFLLKEMVTNLFFYETVFSLDVLADVQDVPYSFDTQKDTDLIDYMLLNKPMSACLGTIEHAIDFAFDVYTSDVFAPQFTDRTLMTKMEELVYTPAGDDIYFAGELHYQCFMNETLMKLLMIDDLQMDLSLRDIYDLIDNKNYLG